MATDTIKPRKPRRWRQPHEEHYASPACPECGKTNWHNASLCRECGYPDQFRWVELWVQNHIKPRTDAGRKLVRECYEYMKAKSQPRT